MKTLDQKIKEAKDERDDLLVKAKKLSEKDNLNDDEVEQFDRLKAKADGLDHHIDKLVDRAQNRAKNGNFDSGGPGLTGNSELTGGKVIDDKGKVRMYKPGEKMQASRTSGPSGQDIDLGSFLRGVVDKPKSAAHREIIQNNTTSSGYELPTHVSAELIDRLRASNPLLMENGAGARTLGIEGGDTVFVKIDSDPTAVWHSELTEETPGGEGFSPVTMSPKTLLAMTEVSNEVMQDSNNIEEALSSAFVGSLNEEILNATFTGAGSATEPEGLATVVTQTETYTNGSTPDWTQFVNASTTLHNNNVPNKNRSFVHNPANWQSLALVTDTNNRYQDAPSFIRDVPNFVSSGVGAGNSYVGAFENVVFGFRLNITLQQFPAAAAKKYGTLWAAAVRLDIQTFRPNALVRIEEAAA